MSHSYSNIGSSINFGQEQAILAHITSTGHRETLEEYYVKVNAFTDSDRYVRARNGGVCTIHISGAGDWSNIDPKAQDRVSKSIKSDVSDTIDVMARRLKLKVGLSTTDVAKVYHITRQRVHSYLKDSSAARSANTTNVDRARLIDCLVTDYATPLPRSPASLAKTLRVNGVSLLDALSCSDVNEVEVKEIFDAISKAMSRSDQAPSSPYADQVLDELVPQAF